MVVLEFPLYVVILFSATLLMLSLAMMAGNRQDVSGSEPFRWMLLATALWCFSAAMENIVHTQAAKIAWSRIEYVGMLSVTPLTYFMVRAFLRKPTLCARGKALVWALPALLMALTLTNEWHGLIWSGFSWGDRAYNILIYHRGSAYWLNVASIFGMLFYIFVVLLRAWKRSSRIRRKQILVLLIGILAPWVTAIIYIMDWVPVPYLDITPFGFILTECIIAFGFSRYHLFNLLPIASEKLVETMTDGILIVEDGECIEYLNSAARKILGLGNLPLCECYRSILDHFPGLLDATLLNSNLTITPDAGQTKTLRVERVHITERNQLIGSMVLLHDVTDLLHVEAELHRAELASLQLNERRRLARDLHDSVTQSLNSLVFSAETAQVQLARSQMEELSQTLNHLTESAHQSLKEMRLLLFEMRSSEEDLQDLEKNLKNRLEAVENRTGISTNFTIESGTVWPIVWNGELYAMIHEALNNILKHAHANHIEIHFSMLRECLRVVIVDDGDGFDPAHASGGMGLRSIVERGEYLGGKVAVVSNPGMGTRLVFAIPLEHGAVSDQIEQVLTGE